jgi:hypothetical protein
MLSPNSRYSDNVVYPKSDSFVIFGLFGILSDERTARLPCQLLNSPPPKQITRDVRNAANKVP